MITVWKVPIVATVEQVLKDIKLQLYGSGLLREVKDTGSDLMCTCPFHGGGKERNPSCGVSKAEKSVNGKTYEAGTVHCFTCGYTADLPQFTADMLRLRNSLEGYKWLVGRYNYSTKEREPLQLNLYRGEEKSTSSMDEELEEKYTQALLDSPEACEYLHKRKIANWILPAFRLGFDGDDSTILFPVRSMDGKIAFYKGRSIKGKHFYNAKDIDKSSKVFGLWELCNGHFESGIATSESEIWLTESEIDALTLISYGKYAVAIMGSHISDEQCRELERAPFRKYILATDNDEAGRKGAQQIKRLLIPKGFRFTNLKWNTQLKDINDLAKEYGGSLFDYLTGY
ncbi:DNA primase [Lachnospiraceae bacterium oral taxon 500]|nr:DNA primase [Lachnospiraceae bacterium oral taxon 500]